QIIQARRVPKIQKRQIISPLKISACRVGENFGSVTQGSLASSQPWAEWFPSLQDGRSRSFPLARGSTPSRFPSSAKNVQTPALLHPMEEREKFRELDATLARRS